jgi:Ca2+-binding EF-hand superfamily protein
MDDNGKIDSYELTCALTLLSGESLEDKAEVIFSLYDYDGNKYLT